MNILLFSTILLTLLALLTYAKIDQFSDDYALNKMLIDQMVLYREGQNHHHTQTYTMRILEIAKGPVPHNKPPKGEDSTTNVGHSTPNLPTTSEDKPPR